jgi:molybdate transport repressor ModE-like protein
MTTIDDQDDKTYRHPWLGVEVRHLATLSAVARTGSFRQAAKELGYVQSAVSQQIARLEHVVGARLVERRRGQRNVCLTRVGVVLADRGERILSELQAARTDLSVAGGAADETIRLAVACDIAPLLADILAAMRAAVPAAHIQVLDVNDDRQLPRLLETGGADLALGMPVTAPGVASIALLHDPFVIVAARGSRVAGLGSVSSPAELTDERLIVPRSVVAHGPLHTPGLLLERALHVPLAAIIPALVAQGHGVGLVPRSGIGQIAPDLVTVPTAGLIAPQRVLLGWHAARHRTARLTALCDAAVRAFLDDELTRAA